MPIDHKKRFEADLANFEAMKAKGGGGRSIAWLDAQIANRRARLDALPKPKTTTKKKAGK